ncbi:Conserved oligomeric Golgi complex subunit 3 [Leucoagaricus sp. SymC.cos]|nr:Conserved oligomeric Golgi complex subunit 3 [Leucoagaricus sp. SymC.cos]
MASSRQAQSRRPPALTPTRKPISVEEWEAKAPLGDLELRSISALKTANEKIPLPLRFTTQEEGSSLNSRPGTPLAHGRLPQAGPLGSPSSRPGTPSNVASRSSHVHALHPKVPVQSPEQFYDWFALIDRSVAHSQEAHFRAHVASLMEHLEVCEGLIKRIDEVDGMLGEMYEEWWRVEENGRVVKEGCERVVEERDRLLEVIDDIGEHLEYFQELERATRMLNHPGESLIFDPDFLYMVERVDVCIAFMKARRHYREAEVYLLRFQQCMTRAMTLIKMSFVGSLRALTVDISRRLSEKDVSQTAQHHLLYTRFQSVAPKIHPLLRELERRAAAYPDDLSSLLSECYAAYFNARRSLLAAWVQEEIKGLDVVRGELVELTRAGCGFLKQLCTDEFNLYRSFFSTAEEELYQYLEKLCDILYDDLRPRILHEPRLTALCEVCTVLQALMVLDSSSFTSSSTSSPIDSEASDEDDADHDSDSDGQLTVDLESIQRRQEDKNKRKGRLGRLHISRLLQMVLQDAQTRLFFKAQAMIQSEVRYYVPMPEDLRWPELLIEVYKSQAGTKTQLNLNEKASVSQIALGGFPSGSLLRDRESWYPTVRKMVWVLEQLRDFVQLAIFEDIAQEAVQLSHQSLITASENIKARKGTAGVLDGELFLLRHLLILKEVVGDFELGSSGTGIAGRSTSLGLGGGGVTDTLANLLSRTSGLLPLPEGLFGSLGVGPQGERGDLRYNIDQGLRKTCENVIYECTNIACRVLAPWLSSTSSSTLPSSSTATSPNPTSTPKSGPSTSANQIPPLQADKLFHESCTRDLRNALVKMKMYLDSPTGGIGTGGTVGVLVHHVRERVVEGYREFLDAVSAAGQTRETSGEESVGGLLGVVKLGEVLSEVIDEVDAGGQSLLPSPQ